MQFDWIVNIPTLMAIFGGVYAIGLFVGTLRSSLITMRENIEHMKSVGKKVDRLTFAMNEVRAKVKLHPISHD